ncbi:MULTISPECIES: hypothetical protein [Bacillus cereus group]|uniref:Uncharacterized protein n=1 Tax=Bacillus cereus TaxID=1396 RepID=A0A2C1ZSQ1_BACCE|nr:hypothetical protein [Bacillus cereus]PDY84004.1 hypothetical protein CON06_04360 [Bacillus cereus]PFA11900.1 hypothetical protein CN382_18115 [Bacillus cereus]PFM39639.1 hypothetical protein COJ43_14910 [Bacillus cereus]PGL60487.1 hypothetical protein CN927_14410 [Bacillus cereus]PGQ06231.1 hypothetical protein COA08_23205 [Bacillus cereus]
MPIIRDIRVSFLKRKENISSLEVLKLTSSSNYDEEISFFKETSCITSLYGRHIKKLRTEYEKGILIYCVDDISLLNQWEKQYRIFPEYMNVFVEYGSEKDFLYLLDREKKELALRIVHSEMKNLAGKYDWDIEVLEKAYNKILDLDYKNELVYIKKSSPNKKYVCSIICQHEVAYADIYLEIREYRTRRLIKKEKLIREEDMYKMFNHVSDVAWKLNHKVMLMNDKGKTMWMLTFLEKNDPDNLVWKMERIEES